MSTVSLTGWAIVIFLFAQMVLSSFYFGSYSYKVATRMSNRRNRLLYRKWGVEKDLLGSTTLARSVILAIVFCLGTAYVFLFALISISLIIEGSAIDSGHCKITSNIAILAFVSGLIIEAGRIANIQAKIGLLTDLGKVYHQRFRVSELLSMYESLRHAPPLFWEEYANLPNREITEENNRKYRERAASYHYSQSRIYNRVMVAVTVIAVGLTAILTVLTVGDIFPAIRDIFS